mmetsp:Transcript_28776/g.81039  ORF Transcript_28776/g.81039 Transcript_28776/m.81039 type:complete len:221 (-) Transcript_28776:239-901(-)
MGCLDVGRGKSGPWGRERGRGMERGRLGEGEDDKHHKDDRERDDDAHLALGTDSLQHLVDLLLHCSKPALRGVHVLVQLLQQLVLGLQLLVDCEPNVADGGNLVAEVVQVVVLLPHYLHLLVPLPADEVVVALYGDGSIAVCRCEPPFCQRCHPPPNLLHLQAGAARPVFAAVKLLIIEVEAFGILCRDVDGSLQLVNLPGHTLASLLNLVLQPLKLGDG